MMNKQQPEEVIAKNKDSLQSIARSLKLSQGQFSLIVARCNYGMLRQEIVQQLRETVLARGVEIREIFLPPFVETLYTTLDHYKQKEYHPEKQWALMVLGLEEVQAIDKLLTSTNTVREEFRKNFPFPVVLWANDALSKKLIRLVPDIESWATTYEFSLSPGQIINFLKHKAEKVFSAVLDAGAEKFLPNSAILGADYSTEIELASEDLRHWGINLEPELEASLKFLKGRYYYADRQIERALYYYQHSLRFWQHATREGMAENRDNEQWHQDKRKTSAALRRGAVLFHIALCYRHLAEQHRTNRSSNWESARDNLQECIDVFRGPRREDLVAKFINHLGEILRQTAEWQALESLAIAARNLHQDRSEFSVQLAQDYGFLAEVAINKSQWQDAKDWASIALEILDETPTDDDSRLTFVKPQHRGLYLCLLAQAREQLGNREGAIECLETARSLSDPQLDPQLYLNILKFLRALYFEEGKYRSAFEIKKEYRTIQHQFGYIAFVGAVRLKPKLQIINPPLEPVISPNIAREITASGRETDLDRLIQRIQSTQHKLTIIYGPSGVGKSSIVAAGLVPGLKQKTIGARQVVPILLQVYRDWSLELDRQLNVTNIFLSSLGKKRVKHKNVAKERNREKVENFVREETALSKYSIYSKFQLKSIPYSEAIVTETKQNFDTIKCNSAKEDIENILEKLKTNSRSNRLNVLIFDQFEEFFFFCKEANKSREFFNFLSECLNIPFVKIVLCLRDDYLHKLLESSRSIDKEVVDNDLLGDILSKDNLFYLGNFSQEQAYQVIDSLTKRSHFYLQPTLIQELVKDLAGDFGEVRPIELQVVGAQLQADNIATLTKYRELGEKPKQKLVERFLKEVVKDCGPENERTAQKVLYLLTDEHGTRPLNTQGELLASLPGESPEKLELVLEILEESGLVFRWTEIPSAPYQLFHDYLVDFIRKQEEEELEKERKAEQQAELEAARQREEFLRDRNLKLMQQKEQDTKIKKMQSQQTVGLSLVLVVVLALAGLAFTERKRAEDAEKLALSAGSEALALFNYDNPLRRLISSVKIGKQFLAQTKTTADQKNKIAEGLRLAVSRVQEINRFSGHSKNVLSVTFSPDGSFLASGGADGIIKLFQYPDGREIATIEADKLAVSDIDFSPDGKLLASAGGEEIIKIWKLDNPMDSQPAMVFEGHADLVTSVSFSPDGKMLVSGSADGIIKLWSIEEGRFLENLGTHEGEVTSVSFSGDGKTVASASGDESANGQNTIKLWSVDGKLLQTLPGHGDWIYSISLSPDGGTIASASADKTIKLWSVDGKELKTLKGHSDEVLEVVFSLDGKAIASASRDKTVKIWSNEGSDSTLLKTLEGHQDDVWAASFSPDGRTIASASGDSVHLWSRDRTPLRQILAGHSDWVYGVSLSPDGRTIATASRDKTINLWSLEGELLHTLAGHEEQVNWVSFSPNGEILASASDDNTMKLWNVETGRILMSLEGHEKKVVAAAFHPDGDRLASIGEDKTLKIWKVADGKLLYSIEYSELIESDDRLKSLSYSPDSETIAIATRNQVRLWSGDPNAIRTIKFDERAELNSISFSPNSEQLAIAVGKKVQVFSLEGELIDTFSDTELVSKVSFSSDGKTVVIAALKKVKLLPFDGRKFGLKRDALPVILENEDRVIDLTIGPKGENIVIASKDKAIVWKKVNNLALEDIVERSCQWLEAYLKTNDKVETSDRSLCYDVGGRY